MKRTLQVHLGNEGRLVGTLHYDQNGAREHAAFSYDDAWLGAKEILGQVERAVAGWRKAGRALGMTVRDLEDFADAFEHPERDAARKAAK